MLLRLILMALVFLFCSSSYADIIYLQDGTQMEGEIVGVDGDRVTIKTAQDTFTISKYRIKKVEEDKKEDKLIEKERTPIGPGTPNWDFKWD